jgi:hypothetical protein
MFSNLFTSAGVLGIAYGSVLAGASLIGLFTPCPYATEAQCGQMRSSAASLSVSGFLVLSAGAGAFSVGRFAASD